MANSLVAGLNFCSELHSALSPALIDPLLVRARIEALLPQNSFAESCFCKGCVLPIVDTLANRILAAEFGASRNDVHHALRCEGFNTPMYACGASQAGFSSHSRSNSYHPGDKSGRRSSSRRSPDFCIRYKHQLQLVGELKYVPVAKPGLTAQVVRELRDYLSITGEPTSDWGHEFGFGLIYAFDGDTRRAPTIILDYWKSDRIFLSIFPAGV